MKVKLLTYWKDKEIVCCCPICNKCNKDRGCEVLELTLDPYKDSKDCMSERSYKRRKGALRQR